MSVHITKTYNIGGLIGLRQNAVKNAGETLGFKEMSLFKFPDAYDSDDELHVRMDGIIASLCPEDIVIFQHPSGESPRYDGFLFEHLRRYHGTKIVAFIQEIASDRDDSEYSLSDEITLLNRADMFIFASAALRDYYIANGLKEKPYLIQNIPDYMTDICTNEHKNKKLYIMAETSQNEYPLNNLNIEVVQYDEYRAMESILRLSDGGFGLIWDADEQALGLYMAAGIPVIVANMGNVARNERILRAGGFATSLDILMKNYDNLSDEAIEQLNNRMWDRFDSADWSQTKFIISYLYEDDYDPDGYPSILSHLKSSGVEVYGKGSHGRHTDNSSNVMAWFKSQYNNLLHDDFSR